VLTGLHRFALSNPALGEALLLKIVLQCQLSDLGMERLHIDRGMAGVPIPDPKISEALPSSCDFQAVI